MEKEKMSDDLISRQAAIDALENKKDKNAKGDIGGFYNAIIQHDIDAIAELPSVHSGSCEYYDTESHYCALNRPSAQPDVPDTNVGDMISRHAAIDAMCDNCDTVQAVCPHYPCKRYTSIMELPSAQPERNTGKWILDSKPGRYRCSECLAFSARDDLGNEYLSDYCSVCGAEMRGEADETD